MAILRRALLVLLLLLLSAAFTVRAEDDPPGRVGRIAEVFGPVSIYDAEQGQWVAAQRNRPLTGGDRVASDADGRAELRIGSTTLRIGPRTEIEVLRLDDERVQVQLHAGGIGLRVRSPEVAAETEVVSAEAVFRPQRGGHFRIDREGDTTWASAWRGELRVVDDAGRDEAFVIDNGRRAEVWRDGGRGPVRHDWAPAVSDAFSAWALADDARDERAAAANRYVSPEMTGAEDLDRNGRWEQHPEYGEVWTPVVVQPGWAPYRYGHWAWIRPWGWTWVDDAPWGFAPFHYGRWVSWRGRWCWSPGRYVARPVYAPALVAWVGGPRVGIGVSVGAPLVGWVPLAPREAYVPWYRASPRYGDRINHDHRDGRGPRRGEGYVYANQGVQTVVPRDAFLQRQPVARARLDVRSDGRQQAVERVAPPAPAAEPRPLAIAPGQAARPLLRAGDAERGPRGDRPERRIQPVRPPQTADGAQPQGDPMRDRGRDRAGERDAGQPRSAFSDPGRSADRDAVRNGDRPAGLRPEREGDAAGRDRSLSAQADRDRAGAMEALRERDAARQADRDRAAALLAERERNAARQTDRDAARQAGDRDRDAARQATEREAARLAGERDAARQTADRDAARQADAARQRDTPRPPDRDGDRSRDRTRDPGRDATTPRPAPIQPAAASPQPQQAAPAPQPAAAAQPPRPQPAAPVQTAREAAPAAVVPAPRPAERARDPRAPEQRTPEQRNPGNMRERTQIQ